MNRITKVALSLTAGIFVLGGWASTMDGASASNATVTHASVAPRAAVRGTITINNFMFSGPGKVLAPGARVTVRNLDSTAHTVTVNAGRAFNVRVGAHSTATFTAPKKAGRYAYHCRIHPYMKGSLRIG